MNSDFLLYGSTGFTGNLMAHLAVQRGLHPILAGRNAATVQAQASELGLDYRVLDLSDAASLDKAISEVSAVLNCAGPFQYTFKPIADACLKIGAHYLDITGEIQVYEALAGCDAQAKSRRVTLLPGVGFDVAPSDCLALHLKQRLPSATHLTLAWTGTGRTQFSRGSFSTIIEGIQYGCLVRDNGKMQQVGWKSRVIDFGYGPTKAVRLPWGNIFMAYFSTGIPNIEDYMAMSKQFERQMKMGQYLRPLFGLSPVREFFKRGIQRRPAGPTDEERATARGLVWGEVTDARGARLSRD